MERSEALALMRQHIQTINLQKHVLAVEAVMRSLARRLGEDETMWSLAGLLHDLDFEYTKDSPQRHTIQTLELLDSYNLAPEILHAIQAHAGHVPLENAMDKAIYCADPVTGFVVACALMHPTKKLANVDVAFMSNRFKEKRFAAGASREQMASCSSLGLELDEFLELSRKAMDEIAGELGL
ncbi:MAG: HDIG domain-containing metalloprotein [bacterium]